MKEKKYAIALMAIIFFTTVPPSFAQTYPKPSKVTYEISDKTFIENDCKKESFFNKYILFLPKVLEFIGRKSDEGVEKIDYKTKDNNLIFWILDNRIYDDKLLSYYRAESLYELDRKMIYNEITIPDGTAPKTLSEIEDISARGWHGFLKLHYSSINGMYMYQYWISSYNNKESTEIVFIVKNNSVARKTIENIMASFEFLQK